MSDAECGAICVRKGIMDKFNVIMEESKLDANELMEHFFGLYNWQSVKVESEDFIPVGMTFHRNAGGMNNNMNDNGSKNSSMSENDEVTCLGVTQCTPEDKVNLLQRLREQAGASGYSNHHQGSYHNYNSYTGASGMGMNPPSMVPMPNSGDGPRKRKKTPKRAKLCPSPASASLVADGEDLLKSSMCSLCQATFTRFTDLLAHHKEVHNSDTNHPLRCRACGRTQTSEAGLIYHQVYVCKMVERPNTCHICGLKFQSEEMVLVHKCSGCPRKKYACEFCDHYRTESSSDLEKHMRIHTNDKCYVCKVCGFSTAWKKNLKEHMVKHLGLKPYVCDLCGYSTSDRHNLRSHRLKHFQKGEGCEKCGGECHCHKPGGGKKRKISSGSSVEIGTSPVSGGKDLECPYPQCVYRTKLEYMMTNHMLRHQGVAEQNLGTSTSNSNATTNQATSNAGAGSSSSGGYPSNSHNGPEGGKSSHRGQGVIGNASTQFGVNSASPASSASSSSSVPPASMSASQSIPSALVATSAANQLPLEWKNIGQAPPPGVCGMLSPPTHFNPLVHHQQGPLPTQPLSTWPTPLSPPTVPPGLLSNRVSVPMGGQNMVARPMPVFPNMPN